MILILVVVLKVVDVEENQVIKRRESEHEPIRESEHAQKSLLTVEFASDFARDLHALSKGWKRIRKT